MIEAQTWVPRSRKPVVWGLIVVSLGAAIVAPVLALSIVSFVGVSSDEQGFLAQIVGNWMCVFVIVAIVIRGERLPLRSIGFVRPRWRDIPLGMFGYVIALIATAVVVALFADIDEGPIEELFSLPMWIRVAMFITAPITEEILFRGYALERLAILTKRIWVAGVITSAFFVLLHAPFYGLKESLIRIPVTIVFTVLYIRRRSLWPVFVTHLLFDMALLFA